MTDDSKTTTPNWLVEQMKAAAAEVATWPEWKRDAMRAEVAAGPRRFSK